MYEKIRDIQNSFWKAYTSFYRTRDMRQYNIDVNEILDRYRFEKPLHDFCIGIKLSWAPIINGLKEWS